MEIMVTKSYLDMARCFDGAQVCRDSNEVSENSVFTQEFAMVSCVYIYSYLAITAFVSEQLYEIWRKPSNKLREKYSSFEDFKDLMWSKFRDMNRALKELAQSNCITPIHEAKPKLWHELNTFMREYRNYFAHPDPESFRKFVTEISGHDLNLGPRVATEIIRYFYTATETPVPGWAFRARDSRPENYNRRHIARFFHDNQSRV